MTIFRGALVLGFAGALGACASDPGESCPSGVRLDGKCLTASDAGVPDVDETVGKRPDAGCTDDAELTCGAATDAATEAVLACRTGRYELIASCPEGDACVRLPGGTSVHCGVGDTAQPIAIADTPCATVGAASCSPDRAVLLGCSDGRWRVVEACAAPLACGRTPANTKGPGWSCPGPSPCAVCK